MSKEMKTRVHNALSDKNLQTAFSRLRTPAIRPMRRMANSQPGMDSLRQELRQVKERSIAQLPDLVKQFKESAARTGSIVYEARDAEDANEYVLALAKKNNVKSIVKSKSMLTEEIELREHLEKHGIRVTETDVGEWIVQLAGEKPSHLTGPAIHKTLQQIAELFSKETGQKLPPEPQPLLDVARTTLRQRYIDADMGISGVNYAIAETGSVVIVTNEGNGCMSTTLPPVYVAMVGYEKFIASLEDTLAIQRLLARSTMGMKLTVYNSIISGPSRADSITLKMSLGGQGPKEFHIVMVDNGRLQMRDSDVFREALYCIKCGACLNTCPVFASLSGQTYGYIYQGGIGAILTAFMHGMDKAKDVADLCMGCMSCKEVCPVQIDIPRMITQLKAKIVEESGLSWKRRTTFGGILKHPARLDKVLRLGPYVMKPFTDKDSMMRHLPRPLNEISQEISFPALSRHPLRGRLKKTSTAVKAGQPKVAIYAGCVTDYAYPELGEDAKEILMECGADTFFPGKQTCCGAPAFYSGDVKTALSLAKANIRALEEQNSDYVVTFCPGCAAMLKNEYPLLTANEPEWNRRAKALSDKIRDFSQLVLELTPSAEKKPAQNKKVTYHDPCHLRRGLGIFEEPRKLLVREGFEIVEMPDCDVCCGFGGEMLLNYPELSGEVLKHKLDSVEASGVDTVVTNCTACVLQLRGGLDKRKSNIKVMHTAELLAKSRKEIVK
jgi:iron-sulfur cluster protein